MSKVGKTSQQVIETGFKAKALWESPEFNEATDDLDAQWTAAWKRETDPAKREALWHSIRSLQSVRDQVYQMMNDGEIEASASKRISTR